MTETATVSPLRDRNLRIALLTAIKNYIDDEITAERADHRDELVARYLDEGVKSFDVKLPDGGRKVATISLSVPKASLSITDQAAFEQWASDNAPEVFREEHYPAIPRQVIPARKARTERVFHNGRAGEYLTRLKPFGDDGAVVDPDTGALVDGVTYTPQGTPKSFSVRFEADGRDDLARAWRNGLLEHITDGSVLPAITNGGE